MVGKLFFLLEKLTIRFKTLFHDISCKSQVTSQPSTKFSIEAKVINIINDPSKINIGSKTNIKGELLVFPYGGKITIGQNCFIGEDVRIWSGDRIEIGNDVLISHQVNIIDTNSHEINHIERSNSYKSLLIEGHPQTKGSIITKPIKIEDHVWISCGVNILKGVTIGKGAIIAAGSLITEDVQEFTLVGGNPAKLLKKLKE